MDLAAPPRRRDRGLRAVVLAVVTALAVTACGIRVETPPPELPSPGPLEIARQDAAVAAAELARDAATAAAVTDDERLFAVLERVRLDAETHVAALGGVYSAEEGAVVDPETLVDLDAARDEEDEGPPDPVDPESLVTRLVAAASADRAASDTVADAGLAQLLAVVATSRLLAADALARRLGAERPTLGGAGLPTALPAGPGGGDLATIVLAEDQAAFALETITARSSEDDVRTRARTNAARHRATSDAWADLADLDGPGADPRSVAYALAGSADSAESRTLLAARAEAALVTSYAALLALAEPGHRAELAELHTLAAESARRWGEAPGALPGLPDAVP